MENRCKGFACRKELSGGVGRLDEWSERWRHGCEERKTVGKGRNGGNVVIERVIDGGLTRNENYENYENYENKHTYQI